MYVPLRFSHRRLASGGGFYRGSEHEQADAEQREAVDPSLTVFSCSQSHASYASLSNRAGKGVGPLRFRFNMPVSGLVCEVVAGMRHSATNVNRGRRIWSAS